MDKKVKIREKTKEVLEFLALPKKTKTFTEDLEQTIKIYKYVLQNIRSNFNFVSGNYKNEQEAYLTNLLVGLEQNPGLPITNSILFKHLLDMCGKESYIIVSKSNNSDATQISNLVKVGNEFYYFDSALEKMIHDEQAMGDEVFMMCAALGKQDYERLYTPIKVISDFGSKKTVDLPRIIATESIPKTIVNGINYRLPNLINKNAKSQEDVERE